MSQELRPTYTLGSPAERTGLGGLSMKTTLTLLSGMVTFVLFSLVGATKAAFLVVLPATGIIAAITYIKIGGRNLAEIAQMVVQDMLRNNRQEQYYVSGGFSDVPYGAYQLPGMLAATRLAVGKDHRGEEFAVIVDDNFAEATVVLDVQLSGQSAVTQDERNVMTASWGSWLASLSLSGDIRSASVTVATFPSSGELVRQEVNRIVVDDAPAIAKQILAEAADELSAGLPEISAHVAVTFKISREQLQDDAFLDVLATRLPALIDPLVWAGMLAEPMNQDKLCARVHTAFNPASEVDFEQLGVQGVSHGMGWGDIGPSMAVTERSLLRHESVISRTWEMTQAPRANFEDRVLTRLLAPHPRLLRKRVTLVYRPFEAGAGARRVEAEHQDALVAANAGRGAVSARAEVRLEQTQASRRAQARGAQLGRYSLFVTTTVDDESKLRAVNEDVSQLAATSGIRLKVAARQQDTAFTACLGVGSAPWVRSSLVQAPALIQKGFGDD